jgi:hypothetical protein
VTQHRAMNGTHGAPVLLPRAGQAHR